ncbi:MFS transporter [Lichenicoccus sp.]|uniref:MFS transporter n=1 Tax=Lichenicoccus sp. TaxID=2781899 RepID=UPI003D11FA8A
MMEQHWTAPGGPAYRRINVALFLSGYATFSLLYCVQPLLPLFSRQFRLDAAQSALALSVTTGLLAPSILLASALSEATSRKALMAASLTVAALLDLLAAMAPNWSVLLLLRALEGIALGGAPAIAMTYLAEEIHPDGLGRAMGLYVGGTAIGGMAGRLLTGFAAQLSGWRGALAVIGLLGAASALAFMLLLPTSRNFRARPGFDPGFHLAAWTRQMRNPCLRALFAIGGLLMGAFVTLYNAATYRLLAPPYRLDQAEIGAIFTIYLLGTAASATAGTLVDRVGRTPVLAAALGTALLGLLLTLLAPLALVIGGLAVFTVGFFAGHAVASGSVGRLARGEKAHAASLYLLAYYLGSSLLSLVGGWLWEIGGWPAVAWFCAGLLLAALMLGRLAAPVLLAPLLLLAAGSSSVSAREIPSSFMQAMIRAESVSPAPAPADMPPIRRLRIAGETVQLGTTPIDTLAGRLGVAVEHQGDAGDSISWFCVRLDLLPGTRHAPRDAHAPSLWVIADAQTASVPRAVSAIALDAIGREARRCPVPARAVDLTLDPRIARPGASAAHVTSLYGQRPARRGRSAYSLPGMQPDTTPLTLTLSMRNNHVETSWLAETPDN